MHLLNLLLKKTHIHSHENVLVFNILTIHADWLLSDLYENHLGYPFDLQIPMNQCTEAFFEVSELIGAIIVFILFLGLLCL
jgi:hypothetical protein